MNQTEMHKHFEKRCNKNSAQYRRGRIMGGTLVVAAGVLWLLHQTGFIVLPGWVFSWQMLVIGIGLYSGARHSFMSFGWIFPVLIGVAFLVDEYTVTEITRYFWPLFIIFIGLIMIFKPKGKNWQKWKDWQETSTESAGEDRIELISIFGGVKKNILSKDFKGGEIVNIFGGSSVNMMQADINGTVVLELTQVFGGTKIVVPSNWEVKSEAIAIFGGVDDKRPTTQNPSPNKIIVLKGTTIFGGIDIKSY